MENIPENLELINKFPVLPELKKTESLFPHKDLPRLLAVSEINTLLKPEKKDSAINDLESLSQGLNDETMKIPDMNSSFNMLGQFLLPKKKDISNIWNGNMLDFNTQKSLTYLKKILVSIKWTLMKIMKI